VAKKRSEKTAESKNKGFLARLAPGLITGASDDDPSGIGTYSQAGAQVGFGIGWTMLLTYPLMAAIQEISARVGRVTGHGGTYNRSELLPECKAALERWATHVPGLVVPWPESVVSLSSRKGKRK
jgi:Mn2+/Fe2+ NRAMP family transporter